MEHLNYTPLLFQIFSDNEVEFEQFEKCFDSIKAFMKEDDLLKKIRYQNIFPSAFHL